jgi:two-component system, cell cycle sensor histidine kinase and response regulator CckA
MNGATLEEQWSLAHMTDVILSALSHRGPNSNREEMDRFFALSFDLFCIAGFDGYFKRVNPAWQKTLGFTADELLTKPYLDFVHPDDRESTIREAQKLTRGRKTISFANRYRCKDGSYKWLRWNATPETNQQLIYAVARDISERKRVEEERLRNQIFLDSIVENIPIMIFVKDANELRFVQVNRACEELIGYSREELIGKNDRDFFPKEEAEFFIAKDREVLQSGQLLDIPEESVHTRQRGTRIFHTKKIPLPDESGKPRYLLGISEDITERKQAETALVEAREQAARRKAEERYRDLVENATYGIYRSNLEGKFVDVNSALVKMLAFNSKAELLTTNLADIYRRPGDRARILELYREKGRVDGVEVEWKRQDGSFITIRLSGRAVADDHNTEVEVIVEDVTERRLLENQFRQAQKMEAVGRLSGGIAHDFNNLLGVIIGYSEVLLDRLNPEERLHKNAQEIKKAGERAASLTRQLLAFSRQQVLEPKVLDLNTVVRDLAKMLQRMIGEDISLVTVLASTLARVKADQGQIEQVLMNLAVNARDAMVNGGTLSIETANMELDEAYARYHPPTQPGHYVMLAMTDTGCGMDAETQAHIFEPFFTTKEVGKGTGLGLATVFGVVKQSGGYIWVYSEPGRGTTFKIYLPAVNEPIETGPASGAPLKAVRATETVLVVEDDEALRKLTCECLEENGYTVLAAKNPAEAIEESKRHEGTIHLLVTDMVMPGMNGRELAARLAELRPEMRVLYVSGYTDDAIIRHFILEPGLAFLQKPFTQKALERKLRELLDSSNVRLQR